MNTECRVCVLVKDARLKRKIELCLMEHAAIVSDAEGADVVFVDGGSGIHSRARTVEVGRGYELDLPLSLDAITGVLGDERDCTLSLCDNHCARLGTRLIRLTEVEYALLEQLLRAGGDFVTRGELLQAVWHNGADEQVVNVYIHYLRKKLEYDGDRIIINSRRDGYRISEKYIDFGGVSDGQDN